MKTPGRIDLRARWLFLASGLGILALGLTLAAQRIKQADEQMRSDLLQQATLVSWAINANEVSHLSGTAADEGTPRYQRIKEQLVKTRTLYPGCRFLYLMRRTEAGQIIFLADSEPTESEHDSPPGQVYEEASPLLRETLTRGVAMTEGPIPDRWGTWVSALVPLFLPASDQVVGVLGLDIEAGLWKAQALRPAAVPLLFTLLILLALGGGYYAYGQSPRDRDARPSWRQPEWQLTLVLGLLLTGLATYLAHDAERRTRREAFQRIAAAQASLMQQALSRLELNDLEGMARFFVGSEFVDRREFAEFAGYLLNRPYAQAWAWVPMVVNPERPEFELAVQQGGAPGFRVWQHGPSGEPVAVAERDVYYPVCYVEPSAGNEAALGFDHGSTPVREAALAYAARTGLTTATDPLALLQWPSRTNGVVVYRPVFARDDPRRLSGFSMVALHMDILLNRTLNREAVRNESANRVALYQINEGGAAFLLANIDSAYAPARPGEADIQHRPGPIVPLLAPIFAFGKVYAFDSRPGPRFDALYPIRAGRQTSWTGLLLTLMLGVLVANLSSRRAALKKTVAERTAELRASEASYHGLFNSIQQAIYIQDVEGRFLDVNDGAIAMYDYPREDFLGRTPEFLAAPGRNDMAALASAMQRALQGEPQHLEFWGLRKNGEVFPKELWLYSGSYFGQAALIAIASDISERKRADEERARLQSQLQQAQKLESIGRLAGGVAHDFNNMLQTILGNAALGLDELGSGHPVREYLEEIQKSAKRSADLTRQLLAFASRQTVSPRVIDLNDTIGGMLKMLRRLIGENIHLHWSPGSDLWPVKMDPTQVDQILANLAVNARDAMAARGTGTVTIETSNLRGAPAQEAGRAGDYVVLTVRDNGRGMDEETRSHIFEPFYTTKERGKGVGLGLATVFGIVKQNQGYIEVTSALDSGSVFTIGIPRSELAVTPEKIAAPTERATAGGRETLLLVEDEESILRVGQEALRRLGYQVLAAESPARALDVARTHRGPIHLLITDVVLPGMNGRELAQLLSAITPGLKCLFMSGYTADIIATRGVVDEKVYFIQKPFRLDDLAAKVRDVLEGRPHA